MLIDDLVHRHADEPYRLLTSRAAWRLQLSQDTAHARLTGKAFRSGLVSQARWDQVQRIIEWAADDERTQRCCSAGWLATGLVEDQRLYEGYRGRSARRRPDPAQWRGVRLPRDLDFTRLPVKAEVRERLARARPETVADAIAVRGITEADISTLLTFIADQAGDVSRETLEEPGDTGDE